MDPDDATGGTVGMVDEDVGDEFRSSQDKDIEEQDNVSEEPDPKRQRGYRAGRDTDSSTPEEDWFHASEHINELEKFKQAAVTDRCLYMVDLFSASGMAAATFEKNGYVSKPIDILRGHDITSRAGFFAIFTACWAAMRGGLILAGPPCSLFIFLSSSMHRRSAANDFLGDTRHAKVRLSNARLRLPRVPTRSTSSS